jgi:hypothetical protein
MYMKGIDAREWPLKLVRGIRKAEIEGRIFSVLSSDHISLQAHRISTASFDLHSRVHISAQLSSIPSLFEF